MLTALFAGLFLVQDLTAQISGQVVDFYMNRYNSAPGGIKLPVQLDEILGTVHWRGWTPSEEYQTGAAIRVTVTGDPAPGFLPSRMIFYTGGTDLFQHERMTILENGNVGIGISDPQATLHVAGSFILDGNFNVNGDITAENVKANVNVEAGQDVTAGNNMVATNDVSAGQNMTAGNNVMATNDVNAGQNVTAGQDVSATNNVAAGQDVTAGNNVNATNDLVAGQNVTAGQDVSATNNVAAGQDVTAGNNVNATNDLVAGQNVTAGQDVSATNNVAAGQDVTAGNNMAATNDVNAGNNVVAANDLSAGQNVTAANNVAAGQDVTAGNNVMASNDVEAAQNMTAGNNIEANNDITAGNDVNVGNNLSVASDAFLNGRVGIGIPADNMPPGYLLYVSDGILAERVKVALKDSGDWADFVFDEDYPLLPLHEVKGFIEKNGHLPGVPSASKVADEGIDVAKMDAVLLQKVEELTLYILQLKKENDLMRKELDELKNANR